MGMRIDEDAPDAYAIELQLAYEAAAEILDAEELDEVDPSGGFEPSEEDYEDMEERQYLESEIDFEDDGRWDDDPSPY